MKIINDKRNIDYLFDWLSFLSVILSIFYVLIIIEIFFGRPSKEFTYFIVMNFISFLIGIFEGFINNKYNLPVYILIIRYCLILMFFITSNILLNGKVDIMLVLVVSFIFLIGVLAGLRIKNVIIEYNFVKELGNEERNRYLVGKIINNKAILYIYIGLILFVPLTIAIIYKNQLINEGSLIIILLFIILVFLFIKAMVKK